MPPAHRLPDPSAIQPGAVRLHYDRRVAAGELERNPSQRALANAFDKLGSELSRQAMGSKASALGWLFARGGPAASPRGLYVWGGVGRGKTMLMDMFFAAAPLARKRRVHFHAFMAEVHERIAAFREALKSGAARGDDPIQPVAADIAAGARLLCFDEFSVWDIADAMILGRLFERLFASGVTVVTTSNVAPDDLYRDGLNRELFLPFLRLLKDRMAVFHLEANRDYRLDEDIAGPRYATPLDRQAEACLSAHFRRLTGLPRGHATEIESSGRRIRVPEATGGVARFSFADLCQAPLGAGDYLKIAAAFHTIILSGVPILGPETRNEAKRFINLIDTLYDGRVRLIASAAAEPDALWPGGEGVEAFEFARTASRLIEMRSDSYWENAAGSAPDDKAAEL